MIGAKPAFLLDGAHNPAGCRSLREYLEEFAPRPLTLVFGAMRDKAIGEMTQILFPLAERVIATRPENPRAAAPEEIAELAAPGAFSYLVKLLAAAANLFLCTSIPARNSHLTRLWPRLEALRGSGIHRRPLTLTAQRDRRAQVHPDIGEAVGEFSENHRQRQARPDRRHRRVHVAVDTEQPSQQTTFEKHQRHRVASRHPLTVLCDAPPDRK